jgi:hypothetical protein
VTLERRVARTRRRLAVAVLVLVVGAGACYSSTPHRAEVKTAATTKECASAVGEVFERSGFVQLTTPPNVSMFFVPRTSGPYHAFMNSGAGIGVTMSELDGKGCHVTLEPMSPDVGCSSRDMSPYEDWGCHTTGNDGSTPFTSALGSRQPCPVVPTNSCQLSYAPGADNDAAVDELARRLRLALLDTALVDVRGRSALR